MEPLRRFEKMSREEKDHLMYIYHTRLKYWLISFAGVSCLAFSISAGHVLGMVILGAPILSVAWVTYRRRVSPFRKDALRGEKELISFRIVRKQYFEHTGQYFVSFDNPDYMHHEVDRAFYYHCSPGDYAYIYRAPLSKYVFDNGGRFSIL